MHGSVNNCEWLLGQFEQPGRECSYLGTLACPIKWWPSRRSSRFFVNCVAPSVRPTCPRPCSSERVRWQAATARSCFVNIRWKQKCAATIGLGCKLSVSTQESVVDKSRQVFDAEETQ